MLCILRFFSLVLHIFVFQEIGKSINSLDTYEIRKAFQIKCILESKFFYKRNLFKKTVFFQIALSFIKVRHESWNSVAFTKGKAICILKTCINFKLNLSNECVSLYKIVKFLKIILMIRTELFIFKIRVQQCFCKNISNIYSF